MPTEPVAVMLLVTDALQALAVPYFVGGSMASATYGSYRATADADIIADLRPDHIAPLIAQLQSSFYIDGDDMQDAIDHRRSFNVVHLDTMFKVDIFIPRDRQFDREQMARRTERLVAFDPECVAVMATAEDTVLAKLEWYRRTGSSSDRQWNDVIGVLRTQRPTLDVVYLRAWAAEIGVADVLELALSEASTE
jgi:hypothetical protein